MFSERNLKIDLFALGLLALVAFLAVSLATYDKADAPSAAIYPKVEHIHNACGLGGAYASHYLLQGLGVSAYLFVVGLAVWDVLLLSRRKINQPFLRAIGVVLAICGVATLATMLLPGASPGPVIGAGGYLGAAGRGVLELHFATTGSYILTLSVIVAGLLLSTDYYLLRAAAHTANFTARGLARVSQTTIGSKNRAAGELSDEEVDGEEEDEEEWEDEDEDEYEEEDEYDEEEELEDEEEVAEPSIKISGKSTGGDQEEEADEEDGEQQDEDELEDEEEDENDPAAEEPAKKGVRGRLASALRIKKPKKKKREEVLEEVTDQLKSADHVEEPIDYELPSLDLLLESEDISYEDHEREVRRKAKLLEKTFTSFGFQVKVVEIETGPVIAQYEVELEAGLRLSRITGLADDLAIALRVPSVRIVAPIPGKNTVGIEVPNAHRQIVRLREVIEETNGSAKRMNIPIFLGKDVAGKPMVVDLASMPHLLIAGRTGTGKSVCLNTIIVSILMMRKPDEVRMLMIDPKMVELSPYKRLPHLMHPVVTDMRKAEAILAWAVEKMEERYSLLARAGVRHMTSYNQLGEEELRERMEPETDEDWENIPKRLPFIVAVADEIADLMMTCGKDVEQHIIRLAQKSRAVGIHLILATQKPTVDVITGLIKSNLPARIAFQVASRTDSRVVLDEMGADKLLGSGDMLFLSPGTSALLRGQGTYLTDDEINNVIDAVSTDQPQFVKELVQLKTKEEEESATPGKLKNRDDLYQSAVDVVIREGRGSVSLLQRTLGIGYGRAARLIDFMAEDGLVGDYNGSQAREVLITVEDWQRMNGEEPEPDPSPKKRSNKIQIKQDDDSDTSDESDSSEATLPAAEDLPSESPSVVAMSAAPWDEEGSDDEEAEEDSEEEDEYEEVDVDVDEEEAEEYEDEEEVDDEEAASLDEEEEGDEELADDEEWVYEDEDEESEEDSDEEYEYEEDEEESDDEEDAEPYRAESA